MDNFELFMPSLYCSYPLCKIQNWKDVSKFVVVRMESCPFVHDYQVVSKETLAIIKQPTVSYSVFRTVPFRNTRVNTKHKCWETRKLTVIGIQYCVGVHCYWIVTRY